MDFKAILDQLSQLSEGTEETPTGKKHKADPGGYGRKFDTDDEGDEKKKEAPKVKRGRGRPKKGADSDTGEVPQYKGAKELQNFMVGNIPKKGLPGKASVKHSLKEWVEEVEAKYSEEGKKIYEMEKTKGKFDKPTTTPPAKKPASKEMPPKPEKNRPLDGAKLKMKEAAPGQPEQHSSPNQDDEKKIRDIVSTHTYIVNRINKDRQLYTIGIKRAEWAKHAEVVNKSPYADLIRDAISKEMAFRTKDGDWADEENPNYFLVKPFSNENKEFIEKVYKLKPSNMKETAPGQQLTVKPMPGAAQLVDPASNKIMATGDAAAVKNIQGAVAQGKVQMRGSQEEMAESDTDYSAKKARAGKDIGKPGKQFSKIAKSAGEKYGSKERGEKVAGSVLAKLRSKVSEADIPSDQADMGAGLGAGRSQKTLEAKAKPDYIDLDKDGNKKETMKKAADDKKKKPVTESAHKHTAARLLGKHHALAKEAYNCKYEDMEEAKMYHEGFKEGLDECYGQMPVQGLVSENPMPATVPGMASATMPPAMEDMFDEGNAFTAALAKAEPGEKFTVGGKTFTDRSGYDADLDETFMTFESWDKELNELLNEGMTVSISKGQQGSPDSVSVSAQDAEADQLLGLIKQAGLGLFGGEDKPEGFSPEVTGMSAGGEEEGRDSDDIGVVDDHDGMMALIKKVVGGSQEPEEIGAGSDEGHDYEGETPEEHNDEQDHTHDHEHDEDEEVSEETCNECGMMESSCECESEQVDEVESYDQEEEVVAEANQPDSDEAETSADEDAEAKEDQALAKADELNEWANDAGQKGTDEAFNMDIAFITKAIAGGLNKEKSTGQTTIPVIPGQNDRMGYSATNESIIDWKKLAGIK